MQVILSHLPIYGSSLMVKVKHEWDSPQDGGCDGAGGKNGILTREMERAMVMEMEMEMVMVHFHHCRVSVAEQKKVELA